MAESVLEGRLIIMDFRNERVGTVVIQAGPGLETPMQMRREISERIKRVVSASHPGWIKMIWAILDQGPITRILSCGTAWNPEEPSS